MSMQPSLVNRRAKLGSGAGHVNDFAALGRALAVSIIGEVRFDAGSRALYATGGANWRQVPIGVVIPRSIDDVVNAVSICREFGAPILSRGGGTGLAGQTTNVAVVIDFSKYLNNIIALDPVAREATVESRSLYPRSLHVRRNDRKQFVRYSFGDGGKDLGQRVRTRDPYL